MINNKLNVGDYVFTTYGNLYRITKVNKFTYSAKITNGNWTVQVPFSGIKKYEEFFECDKPQAKTLELAIKRHAISDRAIEEAREAKKLIGKAKYFLQHAKEFLDEIGDVEEIEPEVDFK